MKKYLTSIILLTLFIACKEENKSEASAVSDNDMAQQQETWSKAEQEAHAIADASGAGTWEDVNEVRFTFNVDRDSSHMERHWVWNRKSEEIRMISDQDTITYNRKDMDSTAMKADRGFINDSYWLMPQMHLVWDKNADLKVQDTATAPVSGKTMKKITITYPQEGGYTPGDAYDFYYGNDHKITEWVYRRGNASEPSMITTWEDYQNFNGIDIATNHKSKDGNTKLYFTGIDIKKE